MENTRFVNKAIVKKDAQALLSGRPVYTDDIAPADCLVVKLLRSPHAHAWIEDISVDAALKVSELKRFLPIKMYQRKDIPRQDRLSLSQARMTDLFLISIFDITVIRLRLLLEKMRTA